MNIYIIILGMPEDEFKPKITDINRRRTRQNCWTLFFFVKIENCNIKYIINH